MLTWRVVVSERTRALDADVTPVARDLVDEILLGGRMEGPLASTLAITVDRAMTFREVQADDAPEALVGDQLAGDVRAVAWRSRRWHLLVEPERRSSCRRMRPASA